MRVAERWSHAASLSVFESLKGSGGGGGASAWPSSWRSLGQVTGIVKGLEMHHILIQGV